MLTRLPLQLSTLGGTNGQPTQNTKHASAQIKAYLEASNGCYYGYILIHKKKATLNPQ